MPKDLAKTSKTKPAHDTWTVRGVSLETRTAVKKAARRSGMTMGAWLEENLRIAATDELKNQLPAQRVEDQLANISNKLDALTTERQDSGGVFDWLKGRRQRR